jgi:hypothetical protein
MNEKSPVPHAGVRFLRSRKHWIAAGLLFAVGLGALPAAEPVKPARQFISHRGVNLRGTLAGENSLEAVVYTRRAGFATLETDVRLTADGHLVVMHDETLNRTCLAADGSKLRQPVPVANVTLADLRSNYILKADKPADRTRVPTLREFLEECRRQRLLPFIEPKLYDPTGAHYRDIIAMADDVLGRNGYIVTSNNRANEVIRGLGIRDVRVMGILYQTTFENIERLGNAIMAISATRFKPDAFAANVARAVAAGIPTESHGDTFEQFRLITDHRIDYVSTDALAADLTPEMRVVETVTDFDAFQTARHRDADGLRLAAGETLKLKRELPQVAFGGIYLEMQLQGSVTVKLGPQEFTIDEPAGATVRHQLIVYEAAPVFEVQARDATVVQSVSLKLVSY